MAFLHAEQINKSKREVRMRRQCSSILLVDIFLPLSDVECNVARKKNPTTLLKILIAPKSKGRSNILR